MNLHFGRATDRMRRIPFSVILTARPDRQII